MITPDLLPAFSLPPPLSVQPRHDGEGVARSHGNRAQEPRGSHRRGHVPVGTSCWILQEAGWEKASSDVGQVLLSNAAVLRSGNYRRSSSDTQLVGDDPSGHSWELTVCLTHSVFHHLNSNSLSRSPPTLPPLFYFNRDWLKFEKSRA